MVTVLAGVLVLGLGLGAGCDRGDGGGSGIEAFCDGARALRNATDALLIGPRTPKEARKASRAAERVADAADQMRDEAPKGIADDVASLAEVSTALAERLKEHYETVAEDPSRADDAEALSEFEISDSEERSYRRAAAKVQPVIDKRCGVRARPTVTTASTQVPQGQ
jgi:gas vesicle protein